MLNLLFKRHNSLNNLNYNVVDNSLTEIFYINLCYISIPEYQAHASMRRLRFPGSCRFERELFQSNSEIFL